MEDLIQLNSVYIKNTLNILLQDKTTKKNIIWATDAYEHLGSKYGDKNQITAMALTGLNAIMLQPRILKSLEQQQMRTRKHAEVFTPAWLCNKMNNYCDEEWFGRKNVFNVETAGGWETVKEKITFSPDKNWKKYVDSRRLEITCGEAPYLVSRYDAASGHKIALQDRIGILDRKLRVVNENACDEEEWLKWTVRAFQSVYGYEFQGDNLLIGRINLLMTFVEYMDERWNRLPTAEEIKKVANIIAWNLWQMDGLTCAVPLGKPEEMVQQVSIMNMFDDSEEETAPLCKIYDWRRDNSLLFIKLKEEK